MWWTPLLVFAQMVGAPAPATDMAPAGREAPTIDLITIGTGQPLYSVFGHAAIRVRWPDGRDIAYNFGGVDLEQPHFWLRVLRGQLEAHLEVTPYSALLLHYSAEDRTIVGRTLGFTEAEANSIAEQLALIATSPERTYVYHHVLDNCTTRIVQLFDQTMGGAIHTKGSYRVEGTYRDWILDRVRDRPWLYLAMDLAGNGMGDVPITAWESTFMPEGVEALFGAMTVHGAPFVQGQYTDYVSENFSTKRPWDWPWTKVYIFFAAPLFLLLLFLPRMGLFVRGLVFGAVGLACATMWLGSDYAFYHDNWNVLIFPASDLVLVVWAIRTRAWERSARIRSTYLGAHLGVLLLIGLLAWIGVVQQAIAPMLWVAVPLSFASVARSAVFAFFRTSPRRTPSAAKATRRATTRSEPLPEA